MLTLINCKKFFIDGASRSSRSFMNSIKFSLPWNLVKFASVWSVFATRVRFLAAFSFGYSEAKSYVLFIKNMRVN